MGGKEKIERRSLHEKFAGRNTSQTEAIHISGWYKLLPTDVCLLMLYIQMGIGSGVMVANRM
jgi:hypothetical protein